MDGIEAIIIEEDTFSPEAIKSMYEQIKSKLPIKIKSPIKEHLKILNVEIGEDGIYGDVDNFEEWHIKLLLEYKRIYETPKTTKTKIKRTKSSINTY